ncbi:MAG TPA: hypothetical protein V6D14_15460 [Coleofasciculaceae cyanobacterium]
MQIATLPKPVIELLLVVRLEIPFNRSLKEPNCRLQSFSAKCKINSLIEYSLLQHGVKDTLKNLSSDGISNWFGTMDSGSMIGKGCDDRATPPATNSAFNRRRRPDDAGGVEAPAVCLSSA